MLLIVLSFCYNFLISFVESDLSIPSHIHFLSYVFASLGQTFCECALQNRQFVFGTSNCLEKAPLSHIQGTPFTRCVWMCASAPSVQQWMLMATS